MANLKHVYGHLKETRLKKTHRYNYTWINFLELLCIKKMKFQEIRIVMTLENSDTAMKPQ